MNTELSLNINKIVTFVLGDDIFGVDIMLVSEIIKLEDIRELPEAPEYFYGIINLRGQIIPILNFKKIFGFTGFDFEKDKDIIILKIDDIVFGLVIDKVLKVIDFEKSQIGLPPSLSTKAQSTLITSVIKTEDGIISIIDIQALFSQKGHSFLSYDQFNKAIFQSSLVEHYFSIKDRQNMSNNFKQIGFPYNEITKKSIHEFIVKTSIKSKTDIPTIIENLKIRNNTYLKEYLFHKNSSNEILYEDNDFLTLQKLLLKVIIPLKRARTENKYRIWIIGNSTGVEAYSLLFIFAILFEEEFDINFNIIYSGNNIDVLNKASKGVLTERMISRLTKSNKKFLLEDVSGSESEETVNREYLIKKELQTKITYDLFFENSKVMKNDIDLIYAPYYLANLPEQLRELNLKRFYKSLKPSGILLTGNFENLDKLKHDFKTSKIGSRNYYNRV